MQNSRARTCFKKSAEFSVENRFGKHSNSPAQQPSFFFKAQRPAATPDHPHAVAHFSLNTIAPFGQPRAAAGFFLYKKHCPNVYIGSPPPPPRAQQPLFFLRSAPRSGRFFVQSTAQRPIVFCKAQCPAAV